MIRNWVCISIALLIAAGSYAYCNWPVPINPSPPEPQVPRSKWDDNLGNGIVGQLAFAVSEGRGMELAEEWGFEPDREISVHSIADLGELDRYAPSGINKPGWSGTAFIQGSFEGDPNQSDFVPGILVYQLDSGPVIWIHATEAWLDQQEHSGTWLIQQDEYTYWNAGEEIRAVISQNLRPGEDLTVRGLGSWGMQSTVGSVKLRLVYPFDMQSNYAVSRYDIWLKKSRVAELEKLQHSD